MHVENHIPDENTDSRAKFLVWAPGNDWQDPASSTADVFPKDREHVDVYNELRATRGKLTMEGHIFRQPDGRWIAVRGSQSLDQARIHRLGWIGPPGHWLYEIIEPAINHALAHTSASLEDCAKTI